MSSVESQVDKCCPEEEDKATKRKISLTSCEICGSGEAKYRCPACLKHSCSLLCVRKHKDDLGCSGVRNKTAFVTLSHFDEMALLSDYRFLEDTGRFADGATRDNLIRSPRTTLKAKRLASHARKMNITLRFLPVTFTKSRENSTFFLAKEKLFLWHLKLIFPQSSSEFSQRRVSDRQTLMQVLTPYIHPTDSDPVIRQKLKMYVHSPLDHMKLFMKAEGRKANSVRYHELDFEKNLRDNLSYKTIIEYPVLHVVLKDHWKEYPLKGPAEPVSACTRSLTRNVEMDQEKAVVALSPSEQGSCRQVGTSIYTGALKPETEPPLEKRANRGEQIEEQEEGEIIDTSDEEDEANLEGNTQFNESRYISKSPDMKSVDDGITEYRHSSRDGNIAGCTDDTPAFREGAEVGVTKKETVKEPGQVHTDHCGDGKDLARAADTWQME